MPLRSSNGPQQCTLVAEPWLATLEAIAGVLQYPAGAVIMGPRERVESVLLVVSGVAKQTQGDCLVVAVHSEGALLGAEAAFCDASYPATVTALCPCTIGRIRAATLIERLANDPAGRSAVVRVLAGQAHDYLRAAAQLVGCPARRRISWILREVIRKGAVPQADGSRRLPFPLSVTEIASMAGTERETASRVLSDLFKRRILVREAGRLGLPATARPLALLPLTKCL
jgi:CRP-like cAMP-binding protein